MIFKSVQDKLSKYIHWFASGIVVTTLVLWILAKFFPSLMPWIDSEGIFRAFVIFLLTDMMTRLSSLQHENRFNIYPSHTETEGQTLEFMSTHSIKSSDLLLYSTAASSNLLLSLKNHGGDIRLLVQDPNSVKDTVARNRLNSQIRAIRTTWFSDHRGKLEIRTYSPPASLRGWKLNDEFVAVGWYSHGTDPPPVGVRNCMVVPPPYGVDAQQLRVMFDRVFADLWNQASPVP